MASSAQESRSIDHFISAPSGRTDRWRDLHALARSWAYGDAARGAVEAALAELGAIEEFHAFPGPELLAALRERMQSEDANGFLALAKRISLAAITSNYKHDPKEWQAVDLALSDPTDMLPSSLGEGQAYRPYFEMLVVTPAPAGRWPHMAGGSISTGCRYTAPTSMPPHCCGSPMGYSFAWASGVSSRVVMASVAGMRIGNSPETEKDGAKIALALPNDNDSRQFPKKYFVTGV